MTIRLTLITLIFSFWFPYFFELNIRKVIKAMHKNTSDTLSYVTQARTFTDAYITSDNNE